MKNEESVSKLSEIFPYLVLSTHNTFGFYELCEAFNIEFVLSRLLLMEKNKLLFYVSDSVSVVIDN